MSVPKYINGREVSKPRPAKSVKAINAANRRFWAKPENNLAQHHLAIERAEQAKHYRLLRDEIQANVDAQKSKNRKIAQPALGGRRTIGNKSRDAVRAAAEKLSARMSRPAAAKIIAPFVNLSEDRTLTILKELKLQGRAK